MSAGAIEWIEFHSEEGHSEELARFYEKVFGWKVQIDPNMPDYAMFSDPGGHVAGGFTHSHAPGGSPMVYITVDSADASMDAAVEAGGTMKQPRTLISEEIGHWAIFVDPAGNEVGLFEKV